ncbi:hypothetical protein J2Q11_12350 [Tenacibaculum finnmarkense genomovar finnmarkense]|uniref:hypothetical protein n=1 Tax=Tenacibaculum finnmarkense TaxID=2781243 RepID=UPI001EFBE8A5|nr:hypothetical protein [Tenacibaculum finnmarkense]MCG8213584.1 hypothetical protein [Tenacibaculum finnmarkense genomovar finnmarkense]MCG8231921.1 hypothetical protein [Tenacibaculum finnmarkense genomovar finnmarkense]MCG8886465.1 hypothetical protein [Tenacibaculum finnmarkense]MCG8897247.1 hypothetical protein [Tenacibaculum finnmarkense]MCG8903975.1 hypothetical protein [Tenacibaculum finnmarkense]
MKTQTRLEEVIIETSDIDKMKGKYLSERLLRTWSDEFVNESTGEVTDIERNELVFEKGTYLSNDNLSQINFLLQSGDLKNVSVSNQQREAEHADGVKSVWIVSALINNKKKANYYLYADSVQMAIIIAIDYLEQNHSTVFKLVNVKIESFFTLLSISDEDEREAIENDKELFYYKIESSITDLKDNYTYEQIFLLKASNAEDAKVKIIKYLHLHRHEDNVTAPFEVKTLLAKTINCNNVIDKSFSESYFEKDE